MKKIFILSFIIICSICSSVSWADIIDFESGGYSEGDSVGTVVTNTNTVSFYQGKGPNGGVFSLYIAEVGGTTQYAFRTITDTNDTIYDNPIGGSPGIYFLTDRNLQANAESYYFQFDSPVTSLSMDLYDFDNGSGQAVLTAFSGVNWTGSVGTSTPISSVGDGSVVNLDLSSTSEPFLSASLTWINGSIDDETGIDNFTFTTVPIPGAFWLICSCLICLFGIKKKKGYH